MYWNDSMTLYAQMEESRENLLRFLSKCYLVEIND